MNTKTLMIAFLAVVTVFMFSFTMADNANSIVSGEAIVSVDGIELNHVHTNDLVLAAFAGETVPVRVYFTADEFAKDVKVKVELSSGSRDYSDSYFIGNTVNDSRVYRTGVMNIQIPATLKDTTKDLYLRVIVTADGYESYLEEYLISAQRNSYELDVLAVDFDNSVSAGDVVPVSVVIKNRGFEDSEEGFVVVAIPELGVSAKGYFGDLAAIEDCNECDDQDSVQKILYLRIPETAKSGSYDLITKVYDDETVTSGKSVIQVAAVENTQIVSSAKSQDMGAGETKTFELVLVNSADKIMVYNLRAVSGSELSVSVPSTVVVEAGSSKTVEVTVKASSDASKGIYPFTVEANGVTTVFNANVTGNSVSMSAIVLTVLLIIVFVVLLVVLVALLLKKDKPSEEVETSYY